MGAFTYADLIGPNASAAFTQILDSRVLAEINSRLCVIAGLFPPRIPLGDVRAWAATTVKDRGLGPLSNEEVARITRQERDALESWVATMQAAAKHQRRAMDAAYLEAAE